MAEKSKLSFEEKKKIFMEKFYDSRCSIFKADMEAITIDNCNGDGPWRFADARINYKTQQDNFPFEVWYQNSFNDLSSVLKGEREVNTSDKAALECLLDYAVNIGHHQKCLQAMLTGDLTEANVTAILALHYFKPLVPHCSYIIDNRSQRQNAKCQVCSEGITYGDTSFGNSKVWHGHGDIVLNRSIIKVSLVKDIAKPSFEDEDEDCSLSEEDTDCFAFGDSLLESAISLEMEHKTKSQAVSQAIVNAFCESKKNKTLFNKFIPSFLVTEQDITIILYNCGLDILLMTESFSIWDGNVINLWSVIRVWLTLNYSFEINSLECFEMLLENTVKSNFKTIVRKNYSFYLTEVGRPLKKEEIPKQFCEFKLKTDAQEKRRQIYRDVLCEFF